MLDKLTPALRHLALLVLAAVLSAGLQWLASDGVPLLESVPFLSPFAGAIVTTLIALLTPLTRQYGVGRPDGEHEA